MPRPEQMTGPDTDKRTVFPPVPIVYDDQPAKQKQWEYHCLIINPQRESVPREEELNKLGAEGWALSSVLDQSRSASQPFIYFYFIRPVLNAESLIA